VYIPREGTSVGLFDIASIELLPGPQGTLYGRRGAPVARSTSSSTGRPRNSRRAACSRWATIRSCTARSCRTCRCRKHLALRGAFDYIKHDGYLTTALTPRKTTQAGSRRSTRRPTTSTSTSGCTARRRTASRPTSCAAATTTETFDGNPNAFNTSDPWDDRIDPGAPTASPQDYENMVLGAEVTGTWRCQAHLHPRLFLPRLGADYWLENIPALLTAHYNQVTNELRVASDTDSKLQWLGGLYAYQVTNDGDFIVGGFPLAQVSRNRLEAMRFGEATYSFTDAVRSPPAPASAGPARGQTADSVRRAYSADEDYDNVDWKIGVEVDLARPLWRTRRSRRVTSGHVHSFPRRPRSRTWCSRRR